MQGHIRDILSMTIFINTRAYTHAPKHSTLNTVPSTQNLKHMHLQHSTPDNYTLHTSRSCMQHTR